MHRRPMLIPAGLAAILLMFAPSAAPAQDEGAVDPLSQIAWVQGPGEGRLGDVATLDVPEGFVFAEAEGARQFMEMTENPTAGNELGVLLYFPEDEDASAWFVVFSFDDIGYVNDDERDELDGEAILASLREGTEQANKERRRRGWTEINIAGWVEAPYYDSTTNNLTWSLIGVSAGDSTVNHSVRLLGRRGVMNADLVVNTEDLATTIPAFEGIVSQFSFNDGQRYAQWQSGDKVATLGLTALVAGGAGVALAKSGILAKFWKVIVAGFVALGALAKRIFRVGKKAEAAA